MQEIAILVSTWTNPKLDFCYSTTKGKKNYQAIQNGKGGSGNESM